MSTEYQEIHMAPIYQNFMERFELNFESSYSIGELIQKTNRFGVEILSVKGNSFPQNIDPLIEEYSSSNFNKKFFSDIFFEDVSAREEFVGILNSLEEVYVLDELEFETFNTWNKGSNFSLVRIKGCPNQNSQNRLEIVCLKIPY